VVEADLADASKVSAKFSARGDDSSRIQDADPETRGAGVDLVNAILAYIMAGAFVLWLIAEDQDGSSRVLSFVSCVILAFFFAGEDRDYHWWISCFVLGGLAAEGIAFALVLLSLVIPGPLP
jgi:hypothetical protein